MQRPARTWGAVSGVAVGVVAAVAGASTSACGLQPVELGRSANEPDREPTDSVIGEVSDTARARLRAASKVPDNGLELLYPTGPTLAIPANLAPIIFEWRAAPGLAGPMMPMMPASAAPLPMPDDPAPDKPAPDKAMTAEDSAPLTFELLVSGDRSELRLYTKATQGTFRADRWRELLRDHAGSTLHVRVRALREATGQLLGTKSLDVEVRPALPAGSIYAWSTTAQGLARARIDSTHESYDSVPAPLADSGRVRCVGCHSVARNGQRIVAAIGGEPNLWSWSVASRAAMSVPVGDETTTGRVFGTFDPTGARIAVTRAGRLSILAADTGSLLQDMAWPISTQLTHPDWSPDGRSISLVFSGEKLPERDADGGELGRVAVALDGSLGALEPISLSGVSNGKDERVLFPSYSPTDGEWIVFEKRKGPMRDPKESSLWIVPARGGAAVELRAAAGGKPGGVTGAGAPSFIPGDLPGRAYLLFSSSRSVGSFAPAPGQRQLFVTALDLALAAQGKDPSHSAFWLPSQQRTSSYVQAHWAAAVLDCEKSSAREVCDDADDDCDQQVDEDCCMPAPDTCDDQQDNDCDGLVDEGCGCQLREQCGNEIDDDCDLQVDEAPCAALEPGP